MSAAFVPLEIDQGEDFTCQIVWTDNNDQPQNVIAPAWMWIKDETGAILVELQTPDVPPTDGTIPDIALSGQMGLVQIHIAKEVTATLIPGEYAYDLFVTVDDNGIYAGNQVNRLIKGTVSVDRRYTEMT